MGDNPSELSRNEAYDSINASIEQIEQHFSWAPGMLNFRPKDVWLMPAVRTLRTICCIYVVISSQAKRVYV
jgi:hypothetical protein